MVLFEIQSLSSWTFLSAITLKLYSLKYNHVVIVLFEVHYTSSLVVPFECNHIVVVLFELNTITSYVILVEVANDAVTVFSEVQSCRICTL